MTKKWISSILFLSILCLMLVPALAAPAKGVVSKAVVYASLDEELSRYNLDASNNSLIKQGSITMPANVQFVAAHPSGRYLYAVSSNAGSGTFGAKGDRHLLSILKVDPATGALQTHGEPTILPERPIHVTVDRKGEYVLIAFNQSGTVKVYQITKEGFIGEEVAQAERPDGGIFTHQVAVTPANNTVIALGRGNEPTKDRAADVGSMTTFRFQNGLLTKIDKTYFEDGIGPRHLAFHPNKPWVYVAIERGSKLFMYSLHDNGTLSAEPRFRKETLIDRNNIHRERQKGGSIQIHPNGKFLYVTNRADGTVKEDGKTVWAGGENNIAVFAIDEKTGEPTLIQHIDTQGIEARTFNVDPSGKLLVVANQKTMLVRDGEGLRTVPANFAMFKVGDDGKLAFIRKYEVQTANKWLLWMDIQALK